MILRFDKLDDLNFPKLMEIYRESNSENAAEMFPDIKDPEEGRKLVEERFKNYLQVFFQTPGNRYYVLSLNDEWLSAIRLFPVPEKNRSFYAEALETRPDSRRKGYGAELFQELFEELKKEGSFEITDSVSKRNEPSLRLHQACGFEIFQDESVCALNGYHNEKAYGLRYKYEERF